MKIAYVSADHGIPVFGDKGASIHIQEMVNAFTQLGHQVYVTAARLGDQRMSIGAEVSKIRADGPPYMSPGPGTTVAGDRLEKEEGYIEIGRSMQRAIEARCKKMPFDFIYERYSLWSAAGVRAARNIGIPCIMEVNAPLLVEQQRYRQLSLADEAGMLEHEVFSGADHIVAVSCAVADYVIEHGARADCVTVQPNGVNPRVFRPDVEARQIDGLGKGPVIGFAGSLKPWHGLEDLLEALLEVRRVRPECRLLIVGDGPMRTWIEGFAQGARLGDAIVVTGWMPYEDLPGALSRMDVAVAPYPALEDFYFSPLKLFEYMASGRAVVASAIGQIPDFIDDGATGLLHRPGDWKHLARQILTLLDDPALCGKLGAAAVQAAAERSWHRNAQQVTSVVESLAGRLELGRRFAAQ